VDLQLIPGEHFEELVQGAETSREMMAASQRSYIIFFSGVHIGDNDQLGQSAMMPFPLLQSFGNDAYDLTSFCQGCVGYDAHEACVAAAIDQPDL